MEDFHTGYRLTCEGWRSVFYNPKCAAFQGDAPINLLDALSQNQRWCIGLLEVVFSKYNRLIYGAKFIPLGYAHYPHWPIYSIPIIIYGLLPPLALLKQIRLFVRLFPHVYISYIISLCYSLYVKNPVREIVLVFRKKLHMMQLLNLDSCL